MKHFVFSFALSALVIVAVSATTQAAYYITDITTTGIMAVAAPTGTIIARIGRGEVPARRQLVEPFGLDQISNAAPSE